MGVAVLPPWVARSPLESYLTRMAAKDWSAGKLVFAWIASFPVAFFLAGVIVTFVFDTDQSIAEALWSIGAVWLLSVGTWLIPSTARWLSPRTEGIKSWHGGKIGLAWVLSLGVPIYLGTAAGPSVGLLGWLLLGAPWVVPITWKWLSGKEKH